MAYFCADIKQLYPKCFSKAEMPVKTQQLSSEYKWFGLSAHHCKPTVRKPWDI